MSNIINWARARAERHDRFMPDEIRQYIKSRGIPATIIDRQRLGWDGSRITVPILGRERNEVLAYRYAKPPADLEGEPEMSSDEGAQPELYGWEALMRRPHRIVICDGEFDRLVLEGHGFPAVTSTSGADVFLPEWAPKFNGLKHVYICFARDRAGIAAAEAVRTLVREANIVKLPQGVRNLTDFFALGRTAIDFEVLLAAAAAGNGTPPHEPPKVSELRPYQKALKKRADRVKKAVPLHKIAEQYTSLQASGPQLLGHCPFHDDAEPCFAVYPETNTYYCFGCGAQGDVVTFISNKESINYGQALEALERFEFTNELFPTGS